MRALVTTTINVPTVLEEYRMSMDDTDIVIVVGDRKSPHDGITAFLDTLPGENRYVHPDQQTHWNVSDDLGWNCIQRRNIGFLEALTTPAEYVTTIDDDNIPDANYFADVDTMMTRRGAIAIHAPSGWYNPAQQCVPSVVHRGYPYSQRHSDSHDAWKAYQDTKVGVVAGLWYGDPDIDAAERMVNAPNVTDMSMLAAEGFALARGTWAPFNTQNTTIRRELVPAAFCWPGVGRFDDIWGSYLSRAVMDECGYSVVYGQPFVSQDRNPHNLVNDLEQELLGYRYTDDVAAVLRGSDFGIYAGEPWELLEDYFAVLQQLDFLPDQTKRSFDSWLEDVTEVIK